MEALIWLNRGTLLIVLTLAVAIFGFLRGAAPEKWTVTIFVSMIVADRLNHLISSGGESLWATANYSAIELGHTLIDSCALLALLLIAVRANRIYPIVLAGLQMCAMLSHISQASPIAFHPTAYAFLERSPFYLQLGVLALGILLHARRIRIHGPLRCWRRRERST